MNDVPRELIWRIKDNDKQSQNYEMIFVFDFTVFASSEIRNIVEKYIWDNYRTGNRTLRGLRTMLRQMVIFNEFCIRKNIQSLTELNNHLLDEYRSFLKTYISPATKKSFTYSSQRQCFSSLKTLVGWCHAFMPESVPQQQIFTGNEYRDTFSGRLKIDYIPDKIMTDINNALQNEDNLYLKYGLQILECTGMRIGDLLLLRTDCISTNPIGDYTITWFDHKNRRSMDKLPVPKKCADAVNALISLTEAIREESEPGDRDYLFIYKPKNGTNKTPVVKVGRQAFTKWCHMFCEKHNIRDSGGNIYRLTTHKFRRTLATDMLSKGANLNVVKEVLGHTDPATTKKHYADVKNPEREGMFKSIGIIGNIRDIGRGQIEDKEDLEWFKGNCRSRARLSDGYCTMPIHNGEPCGRFLSRQKCYLCSRYITTLDDLDSHKEHLQELQEMLESNIYGEHFAEHIIPTIIVLQEIIQRLEALKGEQ